MTIPAGTLTGAATFTLTLRDDHLLEGDETIRLTGTADIPVSPVVITIADDEVLGLVYGENPLDVTEGDEPVTVETTVRLGWQPTVDVVLSDSATSTVEAVTPRTMTFTPGDWNTDQPLTVTVEPDIDGADRVDTVYWDTDLGGDLDSDFDGILTVRVEDDDAASTHVVLTVDPAAVEENAGDPVEVVVTGTLDDASRTAATVVSLTVTDGTAVLNDDYTVTSVPALTIAQNTLSASDTFTLTPVDNTAFEALETVIVGGTATVAGLDVTPAVFDDRRR